MNLFRSPHVERQVSPRTALCRVALAFPLVLSSACGKEAGAPAPSTPPRAAVEPDAGAPRADGTDQLVALLSASPMWNNGSFPRIDMPETEEVPRIVARVFEEVSFDRGRVTEHAVVRTRLVSIGEGPKPFFAVLVETNLGPKIVLLQHQGPSVGWWSRVYDDPPQL